MVRLTLIARQRDGLPLAEGLDNDKDRELVSYKQQAKVWLLSPFLVPSRPLASGPTPTAVTEVNASWLDVVHANHMVR